MTASHTLDPCAIHLSADQLAARWQTTRGHLANLRSNGRGVPYLKLGSRVMYRLSDVLTYEAECIVKPLDRAPTA